MNNYPLIIQGGMGIAVSNYRLAKAVSMAGQLGVVSGTAIDAVMAMRLHYGDILGNVRRSLNNFPVKEIGQQMTSMHSYADEIENHVTELRNALSVFKLNK